MRWATKCSSVFFCVILILLYDTDKTLASAPPTCSFGCKQSGGDLLKLQEGVTYTYSLDGNTETLIPKSKGPNGESVRVGIKAKVEVTSLPECKVVINLRNVHVTGPDSKKYGSLEKLEAHPLVVSLHDGKLDSEVCADPNDDYTSLNIKRAVASLLQANTREKGGSNEEVDVFGGCRTNFRVTRDKEYTIIKKRKDLNDCRFREGLRQDFFATSHGHSSKFQSTPLLEPDYQVEQRIKNGVVEVATAKESYLFRPFANRDYGARANVYTKLTLESAGNVPPPQFASNSQPRSIIFENPHEVVTSNAQSVLSALHRLDDSLHGSVPPTAGKDFGTLVKLVRHTSKDDLFEIYANAKSGAGFKNKEDVGKIFTDALFRARSADSIVVAVELLKNGEIQGNKAKLWYLSFAFVRHTSAKALSSAASLLNDPNLPYEAYYGIGGLAGQYCREHVCEKVPEFEKMISKMAKMCVNPGHDKEKENRVIAVLKGLKNVKHLTDEAANKIANLIKDPEVPTRVRVAALETAQSDACRNKLQRIANEVFTNREEDSELRIKAYLVLVECPTPKTATKLSEFLETEPVNQVGSYVTSHLRNLRAGSNPDKEHAREILYDVKPQKKFPIDFRKFSQNYDFSYNMDAISASAAVESNVIFSQKSYVPRSVSLNLTTEVFGHAFNIFEMNGRAENLEWIIERYFGPRGYFKTHKPEQIYKEGKDFAETLFKHAQDKYKSMVGRSRRSVTRDQTNQFAQKVKLHNSEMDNTLDVDLSLKVLGNELWWKNFDERDEPIAATSLLDKISNLYDKEVKNVKEFHHNIQEHFQILDSELSYPTATGLPLRLRAVGSGVFHMKLGGRFDIAAFLKDRKNGEAHLEVIPSASVDIHGEMTIDGYAVEAGVKVAGNLHTATGSDISLKLLDGHGFDLNFKLPVKNSDVLTATTEVFTTTKERGLPEADHLLEFQVPRSDYSGCFDQLDPFIGVIFCGDIGFPLDKEPLISNAALYPLNGHSKVSMRFSKGDDSLQSYQLRLYFNIDDPHMKTLEVKFDTPGSQKPREISFKASAMTQPNKAVNVELISPLHKFHVRGEIIDTDTEHTLSGSFMKDDSMEYRARVGLLIEGSTYRPILEYTPIGSNAPNVKVGGTVNVDKKPGSEYRRYTFNNVRFIIDRKGEFSIDGTVAKDTGLIESDVRIGYDAHHVKLKTKFQNVGPGNYKVNAEVNPSQYPNLAFSIKYDYQRDPNHLENHLVFVHGPNLDSQENKLTVFQQIHHRIESLNFDISTKNSISYSPIALEGQFDGAVTRKSISYNLALGYTDHKFRSKLNAKTGISQVGDYEIDFLAAAFDREVGLVAKREIVDTNKSKFYNQLKVSPNRHYEVSADVLHQLTPNDIHFTIDALARIHNLPNEYRLIAGVKSDPTLYKCHAMVTIGQDEVLSGELQFTKTSDPSGNFKLTLLKVLDSHGEYQLSQGRGTGSMMVKIPELQRTIKGTADLAHSGPHHKGSIDIFYDFERDSNKRLHIETDTQLTRTQIDSKNNIQLDGKQTQINFNGDMHGKFANGAVSGGYEVTLPDGKHYVGKLREVIQMVTHSGHIEFFLEMAVAEKPGAPMSKLYIETYGKNIDVRAYAGQFKFEAGKECPEGNLVFSEMLTSTPQDGKLIIDYQSSAGGSVAKYPFNSKAHAIVSKPEIIFDSMTTFGEYSVKSNGKILTGVEDGVKHLEYFTDIKTPLEGAQTVRLEHVSHFAPGHGDKPCSMKMNQKLMVNDKHYEAGIDADTHSKHGTVKTHLLLPQFSRPSTAHVQYNHQLADGKYTSDVTFESQFDQEKAAMLKIVSEYDKDLEFINAHITGNLPVKDFENIEIKIDHSRMASMSRNTDFSMSVNGKKIDGYVKYDFSPNHPLIDVSLTQETGQSRVYYKLDKLGERLANSEGLVAWTRNGGGQVEFSSKVDLESFDNFHILCKVHSEKLKINNLKLEVVNKPSKSGSGKKINITAQTADKAGISGSVSYKVKENESGFVVEGKGNVEMDNEKLPVTYKATYKRLAASVDKETGTSFVLNVNFNKGTYKLENKLTDKRFHYHSKFCKESKCNMFQVDSRIEMSEDLELTQDASIGFENNFMDRNDNYYLFSKTKTGGFTFDHESGFVNKDRKYQIISYVHEDEGAFVIVLPSREIAAVANYQIPLISKAKTEKQNGLQFRFDGSLYMDKLRKPDERANLIVFGDVTTSPKSASATGEVKFTHPKLQKDLTIVTKGLVGLEGHLVDVVVEFDVFNKKNQKISAAFRLDHLRNNGGHNITGAVEFASKGMHLDVGANMHAFISRDHFSTGLFGFYTDKQNVRKEAGAFTEGSPTQFFSLIKLPNRELLKIDSRMALEKSRQLVETDVFIGERIGYSGKIDAQGWNTITTSIHRKDNPANHVDCNLVVKPTEFLVQADHFEGQQQNDLFVVNLKMNSEPGQPSFKYNSEHIKHLLEKVKQEKDHLIAEMRPFLKEAANEIQKDLAKGVEGFKKAQPDYKSLMASYKAEFEAIENEMNEDPEFKAIAEVLQTYIKGIVKVIETITARYIALNEKIAAEYHALEEKVVRAYQNILPSVTEAFEKAADAWLQRFNDIMNHVYQLLKYGLDWMKEAEPEIRKLAESFGVYLRDLMKAVSEVCDTLKQEAEKWIDQANAHIKTSSLYNMVEEQIKEISNMEIPPQFWSFYEEIVFALEDVLPTIELKNFVKTVFVYVEKKLKRESVNDAAELREILDKGREALSSVIKDLREQYLAGRPAAGILGLNVPVTWPSLFFRLPEIGSIKDSSLVRWLQAVKELPTITEIFYTYRPTLNPIDYIPPYDGYGMILRSHHFFTFDKRHYAFEGSCSYILAQDFLHGNFSIVANLENGKLKSITVSDWTDTVELFSDNTVSVNGKHGDYPFDVNDMSGWVRYGAVNFNHKAGVKIHKILKQDQITIKVSGFYFWRTRGLLGTINNEQYDEFLLPNGHIAKDASEFINSYKVVDSCPNVAEMKGHGGPTPECEKFFGGSSSLRLGFNFVNPQIYREACESHVAMTSGDKLAAACDVVSVYVKALKKADYLLASLPLECVRCQIAGNQVDYGQGVPITSPSGKADVVFVVEQSSHNAPIFDQLVKPLMASLKNDLASKGLGDVEYAVIGYGGPKQKWPRIYGNNGKTTFEGNSENMVFGDTEKLRPPYDSLEKKIRYVLHYLNVELGREQIVTAMTEANIYPFRQGAAKVIILVNSSPCEKSATYPFSLQVPRVFTVRNYYKEHALNFFIISPLTTLTVSNNPNDRSKNIVGFDNEHIYTLDGSKPDRKDLVHSNDLCISFSQYHGGAAFSSDNFVQSSADEKHRFIDIVSKRVTEGATAYEYTEDCTCNLYHGLFSYPECKVTSQVKRQ